MASVSKSIRVRVAKLEPLRAALQEQMGLPITITDAQIVDIALCVMARHFEVKLPDEDEDEESEDD